MESLSKQLDIKDFEVTENEFNDKKITHYVQHPIPLKNPHSEAVKGKINVLLTDKERKRLKKLRKSEKVKEKHEKIHLGLIPAPAPRLKMSSFMRAVTAQAVADPSKVEKEVRRQELERQNAHIEHNEKRRLTKAQRNDKFKSKMDRDTKKETWSALFKIKSLKDPKNFFKVDKNAQQLYLNGVCIYTDKLREDQGVHFPNLVVVEGGKVAVRKYKKLLMRRIKWNNKEEQKEESSEDEEDNVDKKNTLQSTEECTLVWEGTVQKKFFDKWRVAEVKSEHEAIRSLADKG
jgi:U4/U6 small nuclear ribonucleoprotein PRP3